MNQASRLPNPIAIMVDIGVTSVVSAAPVSGGMSGTLLWRVARHDGSDLLLRVFPTSSMATVEREADAQRLAAAAGIPTPSISYVGQAGSPSHSTIVMDWSSGETLLSRFGPDELNGADAEALGAASGAVLARIHAVPLPPALAADQTIDHWLDGIDQWLIDMVAEPNSMGSRSLLHFDFHPANLLVDGETIVAVLDWTNALVGDPRLDLGRTYACLQYGALLYADLLDRATVDAWWRGLVVGYGSASMTLADLAPFFAVGLTTLIDDRLRYDNDAMQMAALDELTVERDAWIGMAQRSLA